MLHMLSCCTCLVPRALRALVPPMSCAPWVHELHELLCLVCLALYMLSSLTYFVPSHALVSWVLCILHVFMSFMPDSQHGLMCLMYCMILCLKMPHALCVLVLPVPHVSHALCTFWFVRSVLASSSLLRHLPL